MDCCHGHKLGPPLPSLAATNGLGNARHATAAPLHRVSFSPSAALFFGPQTGHLPRSLAARHRTRPPIPFTPSLTRLPFWRGKLRIAATSNSLLLFLSRFCCAFYLFIGLFIFWRFSYRNSILNSVKIWILDNYLQERKEIFEFWRIIVLPGVIDSKWNFIIRGRDLLFFLFLDLFIVVSFWNFVSRGIKFVVITMDPSSNFIYIEKILFSFVKGYEYSFLFFFFFTSKVTSFAPEYIR